MAQAFYSYMCPHHNALVKWLISSFTSKQMHTTIYITKYGNDSTQCVRIVVFSCCFSPLTDGNFLITFMLPFVPMEYLSGTTTVWLFCRVIFVFFRCILFFIKYPFFHLKLSLSYTPQNIINSYEDRQTQKGNADSSSYPSTYSLIGKATCLMDLVVVDLIACVSAFSTCQRAIHKVHRTHLTLV